jgi:hypothetical protein
MPEEVLTFDVRISLFEDVDNLLTTEARFPHQNLLPSYCVRIILL